MSFLLDGFRAVTWQQGVMYLVGFALIYLAIQKDYVYDNTVPYHLKNMHRSSVLRIYRALLTVSAHPLVSYDTVNLSE